MAEKEKKKKPFYKKWWVWVIVVIIAISFMSTGDDEEDGPQKVEEASSETSNDDQKDEDSDDKDESSEKDEEKDEFGIGEKVELDGKVVEVTDVETSSGDDFDKPKDGKEFVIVHVSIENSSDKDISYNPFDFKMKNSNGQIEDTSFTTIDSDTSLSSGELAPEGNVSGTLAFEQPIDDPELQLIFEASFWSDKKITFNL